MSKSDGHRVLMLGLAAMVLVAWLGYDMYVLASTSLEARAVIVRCIGVLFLALLCGMLVWMIYYRRYTLRMFVVVLPALAALCAVPLPYLTSARSLRQRLEQAGIVYSIEPTPFESQLDWFTVTLLGPKFSGLYSTKLTTVEIYLDRCDSSQIFALPGVEGVCTVAIVRSPKGGHLDAAMVQWLNALPNRVLAALVISHLEPSEIDCLKHLNRQSQIVLFQDMDAGGGISSLMQQISADIIQFKSVDFVDNFEVGPQATTCRRLNLMDCKLSEEQISQLAHDKGCRVLSISGCGPISEQQCERLSHELQLEHIEFNTSARTIGLSSSPPQLGIELLRAAGKVVRVY